MAEGDGQGGSRAPRQRKYGETRGGNYADLDGVNWHFLVQCSAFRTQHGSGFSHGLGRQASRKEKSLASLYGFCLLLPRGRLQSTSGLAVPRLPLPDVASSTQKSHSIHTYIYIYIYIYYSYLDVYT